MTTYTSENFINSSSSQNHEDSNRMFRVFNVEDTAGGQHCRRPAATQFATGRRMQPPAAPKQQPKFISRVEDIRLLPLLSRKHQLGSPIVSFYF